MKTQDIKTKLIEFNNRTISTIESFERQLASSYKVYTSYCYIVEVGVQTVCKNDETGLLAFRNFDQMPSQWAKKGVNEIKQAYVEVGEGDKVKVFTVSEWYEKQIQYLKGFIDANNEIISSL